MLCKWCNENQIDPILEPYCSSVCRTEMRRFHSRSRERPKPVRQKYFNANLDGSKRWLPSRLICVYCGEPFTQKCPAQTMYCSVDHMFAAQAQKRRFKHVLC